MSSSCAFTTVPPFRHRVHRVNQCSLEAVPGIDQQLPMDAEVLHIDRWKSPSTQTRTATIRTLLLTEINPALVARLKCFGEAAKVELVDDFPLRVSPDLNKCLPRPLHSLVE